jgi:hypothetical protein
MSATALEPAPLLARSEPVVHLLCEDIAGVLAIREAYGKHRIDLISGASGKKTQLLRHLHTPLAVPGPNDQYSEVDFARLKVLDALSSDEDAAKDQNMTVMAAAFCVTNFCLETRDAQLRATAALANKTSELCKRQQSVAQEDRRLPSLESIHPLEHA